MLKKDHRDLLWCRSRQNNVEVTLVLPSGQTIGEAQLDIAQTQFPEPFAGAIHQSLDPLNRIDLTHQLGQDGGLVAGATANFQNLGRRAVSQGQFGHLRNDIGLGKGLVPAYGQRRVFIGPVGQGLIDKKMSRGITNCIEHGQ